MRIEACFAQHIAPLSLLTKEIQYSLSFLDEDGESVDRVLLTGVSGAGKSTILTEIASVWEGFQRIANGSAPLGAGNFAVRIAGLFQKPVLLVRAQEESFVSALRSKMPALDRIGWIGEQVIVPDAILRAIREEALPNVLFLRDTWQIDPNTKSTDLLIQDQEIENTQIDEMNLVAFQEAQAEDFAQFLQAINRIYRGKQITSSAQGYQVQLADGGNHALRRLSHGERRMLRLFYTVARYLRPGGVLLVDEPDMHIHPSQVMAVMSTLDDLVDAKQAQLIMTSHTPAVWQRYQTLGLCVRLEAQA